MLTAHLCGDEFKIMDADKIIVRVPSMLLNRHGFEMLSSELMTVENEDDYTAFQKYLRGIVAAFRLLHPAGLVNEPEPMR
jgi:hypothetical protein